MQATPEFMLPTVWAFAVLTIFAISIVYKWAGLTDKQFPFQGESGFWYMLGRSGRMSKNQVIKEWIVLLITCLTFAWGILNFLSALFNPTGLVFNTLGNLLYVMSGGSTIVSVGYSMFVLLLSWLMSGPEIFG